MGQRGPVPKRSSQTRRRNKKAQLQKATVVGTKVKRPAVSAHWHPIAKTWFTSLGESGQSKYFEPSDWQAARLVAEMMTRNLKATKVSAQLFTAIWAAMTDLLTTEGARRRAQIEIERELEKPAAGGKADSEVTELDAYRRRVAG